MDKKEGLQRKEVKMLKCVRCGKEYIFNAVSRSCPECKGILREVTVIR